MTEESFPRIPERKDAGPVPSVRGAQDAPTLVWDEFTTIADTVRRALLGQVGGNRFCNVDDIVRDAYAAALREVDRKAREDCLAIAEFGIKWSPPLTPPQEKLSREVTFLISKAIRQSIGS